MPHLQFEINKKVCNETKEEFAKQIREAFIDVLKDEDDTIAISLRENDKYNLTISNSDPKDDICLMSFHVKDGILIAQKRELALRFMDIVSTNFQVELKNQFITFTSHKGDDFHLSNKFLEDFIKVDDPLV